MKHDHCGAGFIPEWADKALAHPPKFTNEEIAAARMWPQEQKPEPQREILTVKKGANGKKR